MKTPLLSFSENYIECLSPMSFVTYVLIFALIFLVSIYFETIEEKIFRSQDAIISYVACAMSIAKVWMKLERKLKKEDTEIIPEIKIIDA